MMGKHAARLSPVRTIRYRFRRSTDANVWNRIDSKLIRA